MTKYICIPESSPDFIACFDSNIFIPFLNDTEMVSYFPDYYPSLIVAEIEQRLESAENTLSETEQTASEAFQQAASANQAASNALNIAQQAVAAIPTKTSQLENDSEFITNEDIPAIPSKTSQLENDSEFIPEAPNDNKNYVRKNKQWAEFEGGAGESLWEVDGATNIRPKSSKKVSFSHIVDFPTENQDNLITGLNSVVNGGIIPNHQFSFLGATAKSVRSFIQKLIDIVYSLETPILDVTLDQATNALSIDLGEYYRNIEFIMYWSGDGVAGTTQTAIIRINNIQNNVYNQVTTGNSNGWGIPLGRWFIGHLYMRLSSYRSCVGGLFSSQYYTSEAGASAGTQRNLSTGPDSGFADGIRYISFSASVANAYGAGTRIIVKKI